METKGFILISSFVVTKFLLKKKITKFVQKVDYEEGGDSCHKFIKFRTW